MVAVSRPIGSRRKLPNGYVQIKTIDGWMGEHRYSMERYLWRKLNSSEVVHHIDENRSNNNFHNLQVMTIGDHQSLHRTGKKITVKTRELLSKARKLGWREGRNTGMKGKKHTGESKARMSKNGKGKIISEATRKILSIRAKEDWARRKAKG